MQTPTFVPFWTTGQSMSGLKNELFKKSTLIPPVSQATKNS